MPTADVRPSSEELKNIEKKSKRRTPLDYTLLALYTVGAYSSAMQGFFAIESFVNSLAAIPGMAFLYLIPYSFILGSAVVNFIYSVRVEQKVFEPNFYDLIKKCLGLENKKTNHKRCEETINNNQKLKEHLIKLGANSGKESEQRATAFINSLHNLNLKSETKNRISSVLLNCQTIFAYIAAASVVGLRAIVSIGSTMLGMKVVALIILSWFGIATLPFAGILIPTFAVTSAIGYFIKTSQNLTDQFNKILKFFGVERFIKTDLKQVEEDRVQLLKNIYRAYKGGEIKLKKEGSEKTKTTPYWQKIILAIFSIGFYAGAIGASMQGFFSIDKFVNQMTEVSFLSFFKHIPFEVIFSSATVISIYILFVEQNILKQYFDTWVTKAINLFRGNTEKLVKKELCVYLSKKEYRNNDILANLLSTDYKATAITKPGSKSCDYEVKIEFKDKASYKIFKLQQRINQIYNEQCMVRMNLQRNQDNIYSIESKIENSNPGQLRYYASGTGTTFILLLRAFTSIGPSILGLAKAMNFFIAPIFGLSDFGTIVYLPCIIMASFGYFIKCSQNLQSHISTCMSQMFFIKPDKSAEKIKEKLLLDLRNEYKKTLEIFYDVSNAETPKQQPDELKTGLATHAKKPLTTLKDSQTAQPETNGCGIFKGNQPVALLSFPN